jgi:phage tail sheath protein FI
MPGTLTYPGVYIVELPNPMHNITGVATSIAAFVGYTATGIDNRAQAIYSFSDYQRLFGGLATDSELSYAVQQFFLNGGTSGYVVRIPHHGATAASVEASGINSVKLTFSALSSGAWANGQIVVDIDYDGIDYTVAGADPTEFNLSVTSLADGTVESFPQLSLNGNLRNYVVGVINDVDTGSQLVNVTDANATPTTAPANPPAQSGLTGTKIDQAAVFKPGVLFSDDYGLHVEIDNPLGTSLAPFDVKVFSKNATAPATPAALASQVQTAMSNTLALNWPKATMRFIAAKSGTDDIFRVVASIPSFPDSQLKFSAPAGALKDASAPLGLSGAKQNVARYTLGTKRVIDEQTASGQGADSAGGPALLPQSGDLVGDPGRFTGLYALEKVDLFNLLVIPDATRSLAGSPFTPDPNVSGDDVYPPAIAYCQQRRAFLLADPPPNVKDVSSALDWKTSGKLVHQENGACFFPRLRMPDPVNNYQLRTFAPSGLVAGLFARIDGSRGVWKAPAGTEATLTGVQALVYSLTDTENGVLNPLGVNCFRNFPIYGPVLWGSRTLVGADTDASEWKYVPVRRLALYLEESLYRGTKWAVFEPNDEPLWASLRLSIGGFMNGLFRKGAFQGQSPNAAYFVKCDSETTTQNDIDSGVVNVLVGFAPLLPAEFVVIQIQQMAGQVQT